MGVSTWCFGGVIVVDRVVNVVFRQSLFGTQKIRHSFRIYFLIPILGNGAWAGVTRRDRCASVLLKSLIFAGLVLVFHIVEEVMKRMIAGELSGTVWHRLRFRRYGRSVDLHLLCVRSFFWFRERSWPTGGSRVSSPSTRRSLSPSCRSQFKRSLLPDRGS
jgi:hypothetical protein